MARINIEDGFWDTIRPIAEKIGYHKAVGAAICFFKLAQQKYKEGKFITDEEFKFHEFPNELIPFIAIKTEKGIQAVGAETFFGWLRERVESGRKGGKSKSPKKLKSLKQYTKSDKKTRSAAEAKQSKSEPSPSPSPSCSDSPSSSFSPKGDLRSLEAPAPEGVNVAIAYYCDAWKQKYKSNPPIGGKEAGLVKSLVKDYGLDKACGLLTAYLQMPDTWFLTKRHDLPTLISNLNAVTHFIATGKVITRNDLKTLEQSMQTHDLLQKVENGEI